jgi:cytochrome c biogenesis protein CcmG/thiol:disulfide interchange protein DsbE
MKNFLLIFLTLLSASLLVLYFGNKQDEDPLPNIVELYDAPLAITDYFDPREDFYIVNFFGSWCRACRKELPELLEIKNKTGATFYGVALNDFSENVEEMLGSNLQPYKKIALDFPLNKILEFKLDRIPKLLIIYKGDVVYEFEGEINRRILDKKIFPIITKIKQKLED